MGAEQPRERIDHAAEALKEAADAVGDPMLHDGDKVATLAEVKAWLNACADAYRADEMEGEQG